MKDRLAQFGPTPIEPVPLRDLSVIPLTESQWRDLWRICGPTAEHNLQRHPMWRVIAAAYFEGLMHGSGLEDERLKRARAEGAEPHPERAA